MAHQLADHVCPPWLGYVLLANPLRRLLYTPKSLLSPYISDGMTVFERVPAWILHTGCRPAGWFEGARGCR